MGGGSLLLGRESELAQIARLLARAESGSGGLAVVEGPAGIGKSALLDETQERSIAWGFRVLRAAASRLEREYAFGVVRQLFSPLLGSGEAVALMQGAATLAAAPLGLGAADVNGAEGWGDSASAAMHGLYWLTVNLADSGPLLIELDDAQWADEMSARFVLYLARRLADLPIGLLVAARSAGETPAGELVRELAAIPGGVLVRPRTLGEQEVAQLIADGPFPGAGPEFVAACRRATGGNPFLLAELLGALRSEGATGTAADAMRIAKIAPEGIVRWVLARLVMLGAACEQLAFAFAVLGPDVRLADAAALADLASPAAADAADVLIATNILKGERPYDFVHPLVRAAIYDSLAPVKRAEAHGRAARLVAARGVPPARVAAHLLASAPQADGWVIDTLQRAAREAMIGGAPASAASYLRRALEEAPAPQLRAELLVALSEAELQAVQPGAIEHLDQALDLEQDGRRRAELCVRLGRAIFATGDAAAAAHAFHRGLMELDVDSADDLALELRAWYLTLAPGNSDVRSVAEARLSRLWRGQEPGRTRTERFLLAHRAYQSALSGEHSADQVATFAARALADGGLLEDSGADMASYAAACYALVFAGRPRSAITELAQAIDSSRRRGSLVGFGWFSFARGAAQYWAGDLIAAIADLESANQVHNHEYVLGLRGTRAFLGLCLVERGDLAGATEVLALQGDEENWVAQPAFITYQYALGRLFAAQGRARKALDRYLDCGRRVEDMNAPNPAASVPWWAEAAVLAQQLGESGLARRLISEAFERTRGFGAPHALGVTLRAAGLIDAAERGLDELAEAVAVLDSAGIELELARSLIDHGAALRRAGQRRAAIDVLRRGVDLAARCGALALVARGRSELVAGGARPRRDRASGVGALTASELRVARMALDGLTNREIAQALFVTMRTVTTHLGHVYQKLGIAGREQLGEALANVDCGEVAGG